MQLAGQDNFRKRRITARSAGGEVIRARLWMIVSQRVSNQRSPPNERSRNEAIRRKGRKQDHRHREKLRSTCERSNRNLASQRASLAILSEISRKRVTGRKQRSELPVPSFSSTSNSTDPISHNAVRPYGCRSY